MRGADLMTSSASALFSPFPPVHPPAAHASQLVEMLLDQLNEFFIAHGVGSAFGGDGLFELRRFGEVVHELLLNGAAAGDVDFLGVDQEVADLFEVFVREGYFQVVRGVLAGV